MSSDKTLSTISPAVCNSHEISDFHLESDNKDNMISHNHSNNPSTPRKKSEITDASNPDFRRNTSMLHSIKQAFSHIEPTINPTDPEFDFAKANYDKLVDTYTRLKQHLQQYVTHIKGLFTNSNAITADIVLAIKESNHYIHESNANTNEAIDTNSIPLPIQKHLPYLHFIEDFQTKHSHINAEAAALIAQKVEEECILAIDTQLQNFVHINKRIEERNLLRKDVDYYTTKLNKLNEEKDKKSTESVISKKEQDKLDRNNGKLDLATKKYNSFNSLLVSDLNIIYSRKHQVLGPVCESFALIEQETSALYATACVDKHDIEKARYERRLRDLPVSKIDTAQQTDTNNKTLLHTTNDNVKHEFSLNNTSSHTTKDEYASPAHSTISHNSHSSFDYQPEGQLRPTPFEQIGYKPSEHMKTEITEPKVASNNVDIKSSGDHNTELHHIPSVEQPIQRAGYNSDFVEHKVNTPTHHNENLNVEIKQSTNPFDEKDTNNIQIKPTKQEIEPLLPHNNRTSSPTDIPLFHDESNASNNNNHPKFQTTFQPRESKVPETQYIN